jgi:hypothetical protein
MEEFIAIYLKVNRNYFSMCFFVLLIAGASLWNYKIAISEIQRFKSTKGEVIILIYENRPYFRYTRVDTSTAL